MKAFFQVRINPTADNACQLADTDEFQVPRLSKPGSESMRHLNKSGTKLSLTVSLNRIVTDSLFPATESRPNDELRENRCRSQENMVFADPAATQVLRFLSSPTLRDLVAALLGLGPLQPRRVLALRGTSHRRHPASHFAVGCASRTEPLSRFLSPPKAPMPATVTPSPSPNSARRPDLRSRDRRAGPRYCISGPDRDVL